MSADEYRVHVRPDFIRHLAPFFRPHRLTLFDLSTGELLAGDPVGNELRRRIGRLIGGFPAAFVTRVDGMADDFLCEVVEADGFPCALAVLSGPPPVDRSQAGRRRFAALRGILGSHLSDRLIAESARSSHAELKRHVEILLRHFGVSPTSRPDLERSLAGLLADLKTGEEIDGGLVFLDPLHPGSAMRPLFAATDPLDEGVEERVRAFVTGLRGPVQLDGESTIERLLGLRTGFSGALAAPVCCDLTGRRTCPLARSPEREGGHDCPCWSGGIFLYGRAGRAFMPDDRRFLGLIVERLVAQFFAMKLLAVKFRAERLDQEINIAREIQRNLLPKQVPQADGYELAANNAYARTVGGDFYEFHQPRGHVLLLAIGDISGKSVPAALLHSMIQRSLSSHMGRHDGIEIPRAGEILGRVNRELYDALERIGMFSTLFVARLDTRDGLLEFANAGHVPPIVRRAGSGACELVTAPGLPVGFLPDTDYVTDRIFLAPDDLVLLYTDGLTEIWNEGREFFGVERLARMLDDTAGMPCPDALDRIVDATASFSGGAELRDDRTALLLRFLKRTGMTARESPREEAAAAG